MPAAVRLEVGAVRERDLDLEQHVAVAGDSARGRPRGGGRRGRGAAAPSRREDDLQGVAAAIELEPLREAVERQDDRLRHVEVVEQRERPRACTRAPPIARRRPSAPGGRRPPPGSGPRRRRRARCRRARPRRARSRRHRAPRGRPRRQGRPAPGRSTRDRRRLRTPRRRGARARSPNSRPTKPLPTIRTRPRRDPLCAAQDARERLDHRPAPVGPVVGEVDPALGARRAPRSRPAGSWAPRTARRSTRDPRGSVRTRRRARGGRARRGGRRSSAATTSCPRTDPACAAIELLDVRPAEPAGEERGRPRRGPSGSGTSASDGLPVRHRRRRRARRVS